MSKTPSKEDLDLLKGLVTQAEEAVRSAELIVGLSKSVCQARIDNDDMGGLHEANQDWGAYDARLFDAKETLETRKSDLEEAKVQLQKSTCDT